MSDKQEQFNAEAFEIEIEQRLQDKGLNPDMITCICPDCGKDCYV